MVFYGFLWLIYIYIWSSMVYLLVFYGLHMYIYIYGFLWVSMVYIWFSMVFYGLSYGFLWFLRSYGLSVPVIWFILWSVVYVHIFCRDLDILNGYRHMMDAYLIWLVVTGTSFIFPFSWECHHSNWRTHIFQRGRSTTSNQWLININCYLSLITIYNYKSPLKSPLRTIRYIAGR